MAMRYDKEVDCAQISVTLKTLTFLVVYICWSSIMNNFKNSTDFAKHFIPCFYHYFVHDKSKLQYFYHPDAYVYRYPTDDPEGRFPRMLSKLGPNKMDLSYNFEVGSTIFVASFTVVPLEYEVLLTVNGYIRSPSNNKTLFTQNFAFQEYDEHVFIVSDCFNVFQILFDIHDQYFGTSAYCGPQSEEQHYSSQMVPPQMMQQQNTIQPIQIQMPYITPHVQLVVNNPKIEKPPETVKPTISIEISKPGKPPSQVNMYKQETSQNNGYAPQNEMPKMYNTNEIKKYPNNQNGKQINQKPQTATSPTKNKMKPNNVNNNNNIKKPNSKFVYKPDS